MNMICNSLSLFALILIAAILIDRGAVGLS